MEFTDNEKKIIKEKFIKLDECLNTLSLRLRNSVNIVINCDYAPFRYTIYACKDRISYFAGPGELLQLKEQLGTYGMYEILLNSDRIKAKIEAKISKDEAGLGKIMNLEI